MRATGLQVNRDSRQFTAEMVTDGVLAGLSYPKFCIVSIGHLGVRYLGQGG